MEEKKGLNDSLEKIAAYFEKSNFSYYVDLLSKPWKLLWLNFLAGLARGVGIAIGITIIFSIITYVAVKFLANFVNIPIIGIYIAQIVQFVNEALKNNVRP